MQTTFALDGCTKLRIGNDLMLPNQYQPLGYVALLLERDPLYPPRALNDPPPPVEPTEVKTIAVLKPHEARALASIILAAATEAKGGRS